MPRIRTQTYVGQLFADNPTQRDNYMGIVQGATFLGATVGAFAMMPFAVGNGANAFYAIWLAFGLTIFTALVASFILVNPPKEEKVSEPVPTPKHAKKILVLIIIASAFDSGGDVGTAMARSTILMGLFPKWATPEMNNILLTLIIALVIGSMVFLTVLKKKTGLAVTATIGALATLITQVRRIQRHRRQLHAQYPAPPLMIVSFVAPRAHSFYLHPTLGARARTSPCGLAGNFLASSPPSAPLS
jgi:MFS family permease